MPPRSATNSLKFARTRDLIALAAQLADHPYLISLGERLPSYSGSSTVSIWQAR